MLSLFGRTPLRPKAAASNVSLWGGRERLDEPAAFVPKPSGILPGWASSAGAGVRGPRRATRIGILIELGAGALFLGLATLAGLVFAHHPWPNRLDRFGYRLLPANVDSHWATDFAKLGSMTVLIIGAVVVVFIGFRRDWVRAFACATAPVLAVLIVEEIAKPLVDRHNDFGGGLSYPSGTVAAVAALATAVALVVPPIVRIPIVLLGVVAIVGTAAAVIVLRWHYPTDALGGIGVGMGSVFAIDALLHLPWTVSADALPPST